MLDFAASKKRMRGHHPYGLSLHPKLSSRVEGEGGALELPQQRCLPALTLAIHDVGKHHQIGLSDNE